MTSDPREPDGSQDALLIAAKRAADETLSDEDERALRLWHESLAILDWRYETKALLTLAACAMADEEFRYRLVSDTESILNQLDARPDITLRFLDNTDDTLNVVLPPRSGEMSKRPVSLREELSSRTSARSFLRDDFDHKGDVRDIFTGQDGDGTPPRD